MTNHSLLLISPNPSRRRTLTQILACLPASLLEADTPEQMTQQLSSAPVHVLLLDITDPRLDALSLLKQARAGHPNLPILVLADANVLDRLRACLAAGATDFLLGPLDPTLTLHRLAAVLRSASSASRDLLPQIMPEPIARRWLESPGAIAENHPDVTILFSDIPGFLRLTSHRQPVEVVQTLNTIFCAFDDLVRKHNVFKVKTVGDGYMAAAGLLHSTPDHAAAIAELALDMQREVGRIKTGIREPLSLRIGICSGPVVTGVIGATRPAYDVWGGTVNVAKHMESLGLAGSAQCAASTYHLLKDKYLFEPRGTYYVKGTGPISTYLLRGRRH